MPDKPLANRTALVTGASRGIGAATAVELARNGAHVFAIARTVGGLEELDDAIRAISGTATLVPLDLKDYEGIERLAAAIKERFGRLDILIGNASILGVLSPLDHIEPKVWDDVIAVNTTANWRLIRAFDPLLRASDAGRAVFVTSGAGSKAHAYWGGYAVSKAALDMLVRTYAAETERTAVRVNLFNPGPIRTRMRANAMPGEDPATLDTPEQVAPEVVKLCLPSLTVTGQLYDYVSRAFLKFNTPTPARD
jgi:NAD(P)-dependent dehydrogenase (short-subunit alcohol dehydrogenase family)